MDLMFSTEGQPFVVEALSEEKILLSLEQTAAKFEQIKEKPEVKTLQDGILEIDRRQRDLIGGVIKELGEQDPEIQDQIDGMVMLTEMAGRITQCVEEIATHHPLSLRRANYHIPQELIDPLRSAVTNINPSMEQADGIIVAFQKLHTGKEKAGHLANLKRLYGQSKWKDLLLVAQKLRVDAQDPQILWEKLLQEGDVPPEFEENFNEMTDLIKLGEISRLVGESDLTEEDKQIVLAQAVVSGYKNESGKLRINSVLAQEAIEGNFTFASDFTEAVFDAYLGLDIPVAEQKNNKSILVKVVMVTVLCATLLSASRSNLTITGTFNDAYQRIIHTLPDTQEGQRERLREQIGKGKPIEENDLETGGQPGGPQNSEQSGGTQGSEQSSGPQSSEKPGAPEKGKISGKDKTVKPENDDLDVEKASKSVVWEIEAPAAIEGLFREETASAFDSFEQEWVIDNDVFTTIDDLNPLSNVETKYSLRGRSAGAPSFTIPVQAGEMPIYGKTEVKDARGNKVPFKIKAAKDGTFELVVDEKYAGKDLSVRVAIGNADRQFEVAPLTEHNSEQALFWSDVPKDLNQLLDSIEDLDPETRARKIEDFFKKNFIYSLDSRWSDYYHEANSGSGFFARVLDGRHADCDVTNSTMNQAMRLSKLNTRMVFGFSHRGFLSRSKNSLTELEKHGWVEVEINGQWMAFDGTPTKMDKYTQKKFDKLEGNSRVKLVPQSLDEIVTAFEIMMMKLGTFNRENYSLPGVFASFGLGVLGIASAAVAAAVNRRKVMEPIDIGVQEAYREMWNTVEKVGTNRKKYYISEFMHVFYNLFLNQSLGSYAAFYALFRPKYWREVRQTRKNTKEIELQTLLVSENLEQGIETIKDKPVQFMRQLSGETMEKVRSRLIARNKNGERQASRQTCKTFLDNLLKDEQFGLPVFFSEYKYRSGDEIDFIPDPLGNIDIIIKKLTLEQFLEVYWQQVFKKTRGHIEKAEKMYQRQRIVGKTNTFPATYVEFKKMVDENAQIRPLVIYWGRVNDKI